MTMRIGSAYFIYWTDSGSKINKWKKWITSCISTVKFCVPLGFFSRSRGLRQRDPLSLLLFIPVMVKITYKAEEDGVLFPRRSIWRIMVSRKIAFFSLLDILGKILTTKNLIKKKQIFLIKWCFMCKCSGDSVNHLLSHCKIARELWSFVLSLFGV